MVSGSLLLNYEAQGEQNGVKLQQRGSPEAGVSPWLCFFCMNMSHTIRKGIHSAEIYIVVTLKKIITDQHLGD